MMISILRSVRLNHEVSGKDIDRAFQKFAKDSPKETTPWPAFTYRCDHELDVDGKMERDFLLAHDSGYEVYPVVDKNAETHRIVEDENYSTFYVGVFNCQTSQNFRPNYDKVDLVKSVELVRDGLERILNSSTSRPV